MVLGSQLQIFIFSLQNFGVCLLYSLPPDLHHALLLSAKSTPLNVTTALPLTTFIFQVFLTFLSLQKLKTACYR